MKFHQSHVSHCDLRSHLDAALWTVERVVFRSAVRRRARRGDFPRAQISMDGSVETLAQ